MNGPAIVILRPGHELNLTQVTRYYRSRPDVEAIVWMADGGREALTPEEADAYEAGRERWLAR